MAEAKVKENVRLFCGQCKLIYRSGFELCPNDESVLEVLVDDPMIGETLGTHYVIDECVGEGAMGRVYLAHHSRLTKRKFAIKVLLGELAADPTMRMRFSQEAEAASRLQHTNVVPVLDYGKTEGGLFYLVMEFVEGDSLAARIAKGAIPENDAIAIAKELCLGLTHAHEHGLVHRDFKPENVVLVQANKKVTPKILDFGLAIVNSGEESSARLTSAGMVVGTPAYVSPEQARALPVDHRTDLFALGVSMYEMLVGTLPFDGGVIEILYANATQDPPAFIDRNPSVLVSGPLEALVRKLMAREQEERFQSATEVYEALEAIELAKNLRNTREIVAAQIAQNELETARTSLSSAVGGISATAVFLPLGSVVDGQIQSGDSSVGKKTRGSLVLWAIGVLCLLAGGVFAYSKLGATEENPKISQSGGDVTPSAANTLPIAKDPDKSEMPEIEQPEEPDPDKGLVAVVEPTDKEDSADPSLDATNTKRGTNSNAGKERQKNNRLAGKGSKKGQGGKEPKAGKNEQDPVSKSASKPRPAVDTPGIDPRIDTTSETKPALVPPPQVKPVVPPPVVRPVVRTPVRVTPPKPKSFDATPSIAGLSVKGMVKGEISRALSRKMASMRTCYQAASKRSNKVPSISVKVSFVIDESARASQIKVAGPLSGLGSCISSIIKKVRTRNPPDTGVARVSFTLKFSPK